MTDPGREIGEPSVPFWTIMAVFAGLLLGAVLDNVFGYQSLSTWGMVMFTMMVLLIYGVSVTMLSYEYEEDSDNDE